MQRHDEKTVIDNENSYQRDRDSPSWGSGLAWAKPEYKKAEIDWAGDFLAHLPPKDYIQRAGDVSRAYDIVNNWRSSHSFPLNTFQNGLRSFAIRVDRDYLIAQRIKRMPSIMDKLKRFPSMTLSQMQDLGGCRAILTDTKKVREVREQYRHSQMKHKLAREKDYITRPKTSGYRGIHLIYRYHSDRTSTYEGLQIEVQLRSHSQHIWATAVETVGTLLRQSLKSSQGTKEWLRFFSLMSSYIAMNEKAPIVPNTPPDKATLLDELKSHASSLQVPTKLQAYRIAIKNIQQSVDGARYYLLEFYPNKESRVTGFKYRQLEDAMKQYLETEKKLSQVGPGSEVVLVSVDSVGALEAAYPSYFADTDEFLKLLNNALSE